MADSQIDRLIEADRDRRFRQDKQADRIATSISGAEWLGRVQRIGAHKGWRCDRCGGPLSFRGQRCCRG